jgi:hypothetical protein
LPVLKAVASGDTVAVAGQDGPVGGSNLRDEEGTGQKRQGKRNEKRAANVHKRSVKEQGIGMRREAPGGCESD